MNPKFIRFSSRRTVFSKTLQKRQLCFCVNGLEIEKTTFDRQTRDLQYNFDGALANEKKGSDPLKKLRASADEVPCHADLFRNMVPAHPARFKRNLGEDVMAFLMQLRDATEEFLKKHNFGIEKVLMKRFL